MLNCVDTYIQQVPCNVDVITLNFPLTSNREYALRLQWANGSGYTIITETDYSGVITLTRNDFPDGSWTEADGLVMFSVYESLSDCEMVTIDVCGTVYGKFGFEFINIGSNIPIEDYQFPCDCSGESFSDSFR